MKREHPHDDELQDFVTGSLARSAESRIRRHLAACADCARAVDALRELTASLADLPASVQPARDLRPGIWSRIDASSEASVEATPPGAGVPTQPTARPVPAFRSRSVLAAAATAVIAITAAVSIAIDRRIGARGTGNTAAQSALWTAESRFDVATRELEVLIAEHSERLSPATREVLESSLGAIDAAVAEAREALAGDPGNPMLSHMLMAAYEKKLEVLRAASEAPIGI
jgi:anti-sigma-K factor RskA